MLKMKMNETPSHPNDDIDADDTFAETQVRSFYHFLKLSFYDTTAPGNMYFDVSFEVRNILFSYHFVLAFFKFSFSNYLVSSMMALLGVEST